MLRFALVRISLVGLWYALFWLFLDTWVFGMVIWDWVLLTENGVFGGLLVLWMVGGLEIWGFGFCGIWEVAFYLHTSGT